jgi:REP element-mobilizing transposase RayT
MPRGARIDIAGILQHVMVRGIEKRNIFNDDRDRFLFLDRLSQLLLKTETKCLAWAFLDNHAHLLLLPTKAKLAELMRRLLTAYAVTFNLRHHRSGHLFQNRYKSIVCDEDEYLLELVRYIHLNPLRAGLVTSIDQLDAYKWSGHSVIMGNKVLSGQEVDEVLRFFDLREKSARAKYHQYVGEGIALGKRNELVGGGLKRYLHFSGSQDFQAFDQRILGSGEFVEELWKEIELPQLLTPAPPLEDIIGAVADAFGIESAAMQNPGRKKKISEARGVCCYIATDKFGCSGAAVARALKITRAGVLFAAARGEQIFDASPQLHTLFHPELSTDTPS